MHLADALSRNFITESEESSSDLENDIADINQLDYTPAHESFLHKIRSETPKDATL